MPEEIKDANIEDTSSVPQDANVEEVSSTPQDAVAESSPAPVAQPFHEHPRFKELKDERDYWRDQAMKVKEPVKAEEVDEYVNMDPQTRVFFQDMDKRIEKRAAKLLAQKESEYQARIDALAFQNAKIQERLFRQDNNDVPAGSAEEQEIAQYIRMGMSPEKAAWAVMGPVRAQKAQAAKKVVSQQKVEQKVKANLETTSVPANSGMPNAQKVPFRERFNQKLMEAGL